jgi:hypothetical protein
VVAVHDHGEAAIKMEINIEHGSDQVMKAEVAALSAIPGLLFEMSQYYGTGRYVAIIIDGDEHERGPVFELTTEWLVDDE